jgi:hypothetical protein
MYNADQKNRYLENRRMSKYEEPTIELLIKIFNSTESEEVQFGKDLSEFNQIEVVDLFKSFNSKSPRRLQSTSIFLYDYTSWCYEEGLIDNIANPYDKNIIDVIIKDIIPKDLLSEKYFNKDTMVNNYINSIIDVSNKFIAYALYCGIKGNNYEELINLRKFDLDHDNHVVKLITGRTVKVDSLFINLMINANDMTHYFADGIEKESRQRKYEYQRSEYVIKSCGGKKNLTGDAVSPEYLNKRLATIKEQSGNKYMSASLLYKNGLINHIKERYKKDFGIDLKTALFDEINGKLYTYDKTTQKYIEEFGSKMTVRMLRMEIRDYIDILND